jgi:hypothetical protein
MVRSAFIKYSQADATTDIAAFKMEQDSDEKYIFLPEAFFKASFTSAGAADFLTVFLNLTFKVKSSNETRRIEINLSEKTFIIAV